MKVFSTILAISGLSAAAESQDTLFGGAFVDGPSLFYQNGSVVHNAAGILSKPLLSSTNNAC